MRWILAALKIFLMAMGALFLVILGLLAYLWFADPFGLKPLLTGADKKIERTVGGDTQATGTETDLNPLLTAGQEAVLESLGVDVETLPTEIDAETERCLRDAVGEKRAAEIEGGDAPTVMELFKAKKCL